MDGDLLQVRRFGSGDRGTDMYVICTVQDAKTFDDQRGRVWLKGDLNLARGRNVALNAHTFSNSL
jgi:hypothetical protein